ncbi:fumarate/nitrate reduction transcriptional regulator Fnr [Pokkaliibacter sp. CJK22405]|uniref:fumarate/nitrate reduction transcriptional regulator Fnr n=1 Tax=Pokkaliibacter sp. CJK22405 TaxID=3384615 RepID=UPI0039853BDB
MAERSTMEPIIRNIRQAHCQHCSLNSLCLPLSLSFTDMERLDGIIDKSRPLKKGDHLFRQGEDFSSVYAVRAGAIKTYTVTDEGEEQITGFYMPSELIGLSGIHESAYPVSAKVLETTTVCEIPFEKLDSLSGQLPELRKNLLRTMSKEIRDEQQMMLLLSKKSADERIGTFLVRLSQRFKLRGFSPTHFRLPMSRNEIGNYLGLAVETVSRIFTRLQKQEVIEVDGKDIRVINTSELYRIAGECEHAEAHLINVANG